MRFFLFLFLTFILSSCGEDLKKSFPVGLGKQDKKLVSTGIASLKKSVFSKSCSEGSVEIFRSRSPSSLGPTSPPALVLSGNELNEGDQVSISGRVASSVCHNGAPFSFTCEASVAIGGNRTFICSSGRALGGSSSIYAGALSVTAPSYGENLPSQPSQAPPRNSSSSVQSPSSSNSPSLGVPGPASQVSSGHQGLSQRSSGRISALPQRPGFTSGPSHLHQGRPFASGEVNIYSNGQKVFVSIGLGASNHVPAPCVVSYSCR